MSMSELADAAAVRQAMTRIVERLASAGLGAGRFARTRAWARGLTDAGLRR